MIAACFPNPLSEVKLLSSEAKPFCELSNLSSTSQGSDEMHDRAFGAKPAVLVGRTARHEREAYEAL